jgi:adenylate cyclase
MTQEKPKRKVAVILQADAKDYTRLMSEDELETTSRLNIYKETIAGIIQRYQGRKMDAPGDHFLVEFSGAGEAVQCAVEVQKELKGRNAEVPEDRRMEFRIGINLGEVIEEGERIYGDGVNIAGRVSGMADGGGICISGNVYDRVKGKLALGYEYLGKQTARDIPGPIRIYRVLTKPGGLAFTIRRWKRAGLRQWKHVDPILKIIIGLAVAANAVWQMYPLISNSNFRILSKEGMVSLFSQKSSTPLQPALPVKAASKEKMGSLPELPSIAVLPFVNMSGDPKQEFFSDGITESIITALSKVPKLLVIARNSTFTYKGKAVKVKQIGEELGVQYVLEGSVQTSLDRIRINAQLIDASNGVHIWAERYDRDLKDIFVVQDEVTSKILTALRVKITEGDQALYRDKGLRNLDCSLKLLEGFNYSYRFDLEGNNKARQMAKEALALCPESSEAYYLLAITQLMDYWFGSSEHPSESIEKAIDLAEKAIALDDNYAEPHGLLSHLYSIERDYEKAIMEGKRAVALNPNGADVHAWYAMSLTYAGRPEEAIPLFQKAFRLNPLGPSWYFQNYGHTLRMAGRFEEAVLAYKKALQLSPNNLSVRINLAAAYSMWGAEKEARAEAAEVLRINPKFSLDYYVATLPYKDRSVIDNLVQACRRAGLR